MRLAWFRATRPEPADPLDEAAPIIARLARAHHIDIVTEAAAHDFVWMHFREPYDVCVYEFANTPAHAYMRAYLNHAPGVMAPRGLGVAHAGQRSASSPEPHARPLRLGMLDETNRDVVMRAVARARNAAAMVEVVAGEPADVLARADVIVALEWPPRPGAPTAALLAMAAGVPVIVHEVEGTAGWPALDPQTWVTRGFGSEPAIAVSIDPRDEEHSVLLALKRLAADAGLRRTLGISAHAWWQDHATLDHAVAAWDAILADAASAPPAARAAADHSEQVRALLEPFGLTVDFIGPRSSDFGLRPDRRQ